MPQHLELDDVIAWGMGAADLLCVIAGAVVGWWLYLACAGELWLRLLCGGLALMLGVALGLPRIGDLALREWLLIAASYLLRPRVLVA